MIKPDAYTSIGKIVDAIAQTGFLINKLQMVRFSQADAEEFYGEHIVRADPLTSGQALLPRPRGIRDLRCGGGHGADL